MKNGLQGTELNYLDIDKQSYAVYKAVKHFRPYILKNHVTVFVPHPAVRSLFVQQELGERRGNWMTYLQEYDLEFKPSHIVKGQGLCRMAVEEVDSRGSEEENWEYEINMYQTDRTAPQDTSSWYVDLLQYLKHSTMCPALTTK